MDTTKVIFRKSYPEAGGEGIALFPSLAGDSNPYRTCLCYTAAGQHGAASVDLYRSTFPALPSEYESLKDELEAIGYNLRVCKRFSRKDLRERIKQTNG